MRRDIVRTLVDIQTKENLVEAKDALLRGRVLPFAVEGNDECEKLTNLLAALHVLDMVQQGVDFDAALQQYVAHMRGKNL